MDRHRLARRWGAPPEHLGRDVSRPLPRGQVDVAGLAGFVANDDGEGRPRRRLVPTLFTLALTAVALAWAALILFPAAHAAIHGGF